MKRQKYTVIASVAQAHCEVKATDPSDAMDRASFSSSLCHECSREMEATDPHGFVVLDEAGEVVLDEVEEQQAKSREIAEHARALATAVKAMLDEVRDRRGRDAVLALREYVTHERFEELDAHVKAVLATEERR